MVKISGIQANFTNMIPVQQPTQYPFQTQPVTPVGTRAVLPLIRVPKVRFWGNPFAFIPEKSISNCRDSQTMRSLTLPAAPSSPKSSWSLRRFLQRWAAAHPRSQ